jgi:hypothetical protein
MLHKDSYNNRTIGDGENISCTRIGSNDSSPITQKQKIQTLRESVGEYGIALFAPLLDFVETLENDGRVNNYNERKFQCHKSKDKVITLSSTTTITTQSDSESDHCRLDDDENDNFDDNYKETENHVKYRDEAPSPVQIFPESTKLLQASPPILSNQQMQYLQQFLPYSIRDYIWERRFVIGLHGDSFCTLLQKCAGYKQSIIVIRNTVGQILGGYASEEWRIDDETTKTSNGTMDRPMNYGNQYRSIRHAYYGTGQSFVFGTSTPTLNDNSKRCESTLQVYPWTGRNDYCQICDVDRSILCMGGDGEFGWIVSDNFTIGQTGPCSTYNNPPLIDQATFHIADFEIYVLTSPIAQFL